MRIPRLFKPLATAVALAALSAGVAAAPIPFSYTGSIQTYVVSVAGLYSITAFGAQGGNGNAAVGGLGAEASGLFALTSGEMLTIIVGGVGVSDLSGGGGGGSFVLAPGVTPLAVAGGGGGGAFNTCNGGPGLTGTAGGDGQGEMFRDFGGAGGTAGNGGAGGTSTRSFEPGYAGGGGGGLLTSGGPGIAPLSGGGGQSASGTAAGGAGNDTDGGGAGGFGGGGGAAYLAGGGGGGYSGGGGAAGNTCGGGGGSFLAAFATNQFFVSGVETGNGSVTLELIPTGVPEPTSVALLGLGIGALVCVRRRRS